MSKFDIASICDRFAGVDIMCRRATRENEWPQPWRARVVASKNERDAYRITVWGQSQEEVEELLVIAVAKVDAL